MRILFCTLAQNTHFFSMASLAWALRTDGHEVRVACPDDFADTVTQAGLTAQVVGPSFVDEDETAEEREQFRRGLPQPYQAAEGDLATTEWTSRHDQAFNDWVAYGFEAENSTVIEGLVDFATWWKPDLVLWEPFTFAGPIAAAAAGAVNGRTVFSLDVLGMTHEWIMQQTGRRNALCEWLAREADRFGLPYTDDLVSGSFTIDQLPASLRPATDLDVLPMSYLPYGGKAIIPRWLWEQPTRPRVAVTLGLSAVEYFSGYTLDLADMLSELAALDIEVVATVAPGHRSTLTDLPDNVRVVDYVPLDALVPTCDAVVHHGGFGTLTTTARHAKPQLVLPYHFEGPMIAGLLAGQGAGIAVHSDDATGAVVAEMTRRLMSEPEFGRRATELGREIRDMPTPAMVAASIDTTVANYR